MLSLYFYGSSYYMLMYYKLKLQCRPFVLFPVLNKMIVCNFYKRFVVLGVEHLLNVKIDFSKRLIKDMLHLWFAQITN